MEIVNEKTIKRKSPARKRSPHVKDAILDKSNTQTDVDGAFLALLPLKNVVIVPKSIIPIIVGRQRSIKAVEFALKNNSNVFITSQKDSQVESPGKDDLFEYGTRSAILEVMRMPNGALKILAEGICRSQMIHFNDDGDFMSVICQDLKSVTTDSDTTLEAIWRQLKSLYNSYAQLNESAPTDLMLHVKTPQ